MSFTHESEDTPPSRSDAEPDAPTAAQGEAYRLVVEEWNRTAADYPATASIHALFAAQAAATPHAVALVHGERSVTYRELNERANGLALRLRERGVGLESRVGVCMARCPELVISILAVLKRGAAYVPLDPAYPAGRLAFMLADSGARVLLARDESIAAPAGVEVIAVPEDAAEPSPENPESGADARTLAYVIYTSGSTGTPKGVGVEHRSVVRLVRGQDYVQLGPDEVVLHAAPVSFDASTLELWGALLNGARLVLMPGVTPTLEELGAAITRHGVTTMWLTAGLFAVMAQERLDDLAGVRQLLAGGDVLPVEAVRRVRERFPRNRLINGYGPTENTTFTCCHSVPAGWRGTSVPIGRPIANTRAYVLDAGLRPLAVGVAGELYAAGAGVARGYLGRPRLTAERFVPDPFGPEPGARMYRTGDRVRWLEDGTIEFLGRVDEQVKIRGYRIEIGEIEAGLRRIGGVDDCAVIAREDAPGDKRLVAYVVGSAEEPLRAALGRTLPAYMLPDAFVSLASLPLTPNGKVDRRALPAPSISQRQTFQPPRTDTERALAAIWREVLRVDEIGVDQPFLEAGGHSLRAIRALARIHDAFGVSLPPHVLLRSGTIEEAAALVDDARSAVADDSIPVPEPGKRLDPIPLAYSQEGAWFFEQLTPGLLAYRAQSTIGIDGPLDVPVMERAIGEIVRRHEIFRTTFPVIDGVPTQRIHAPWAVHLPLDDLTRLQGDARDAAVRAAVHEEFVRPFDTTALPLVRLRLLRLSDTEHTLIFVEHHFVHDGWSYGLFLRELQTLYAAYLRGEESPLAPPPLQYADYACWQRRWMASPAGEAGLRFWEGALAGAPTLALPTDFPRRAQLRFRGAAERVRLTPALARRARDFSREQGVTLFVTLMSAFQAMLARYSGQRDFCVGSALGNRPHTAVEGVIGMIVNTVAMRADLGGDPTVRELLRRVRETTLRAYEHQGVPFDQVVRRVQPQRNTNVLPICQTAFSFHNSQMPSLSFGPARLRIEEAQNNGSAKFDLQVIVIPRAEQGITELADEVVMVWEYDTDLFTGDTVRRMVRHFEALLAEMMDDPSRPLSRLGMLTREERAVVLEGWNPPAADVPAGATIHRLIEARAARTPDAVAVICDDRGTTYRELDARANRLAHRLIALGAGPERRVGICVARSAEMVVAMLAVLKSGAAYLPLDPAYPADRLAYMLEDSNAALLVTRDALRHRLPSTGARVVSLDGDAGSIAEELALPPLTTVSPDHPAYVIYTSGSTGRPKGVVVTHANAAAFFAGMDERVGGPTPGTWLAVTRIGFDIHVLELLWTLARGFRVVVQPEIEGARDERSPARQIRRHAVTHLQCTPSLAAMLMADAGDQALSGIRRILLGGEALPPELAARIEAVAPGALVNVYGPTETTVWSTTHHVVSADGPIPIGRPIAGTRAYVLDDALRPQPVGVPGELYLGGAGVARGYLHRPSLTAERFVPDAFAARTGARMYRTGDRARWRADGTLEYLGRLDEQVKIRGFRIEPGEIESVLRQHAAVRDCAVTAREDRPGEKRLAAYVVPSAESPHIAGLRAHLRGRLPDYMVPATFTALAALPLMPNGKLDRKALPAPEMPAETDAHEPPADGPEGAIAVIWKEILGLERVGARDDFFELGGDSLQATRVVIRTRALLGREVPLVSLFDHRTLSAFARAAGAAEPSLPDDDLLGDAAWDDDLVAVEA